MGPRLRDPPRLRMEVGQPPGPGPGPVEVSHNDIPYLRMYQTFQDTPSVPVQRDTGVGEPMVRFPTFSGNNGKMESKTFIRDFLDAVKYSCVSCERAVVRLPFSLEGAAKTWYTCVMQDGRQQRMARDRFARRYGRHLLASPLLIRLDALRTEFPGRSKMQWRDELLKLRCKPGDDMEVYAQKMRETCREFDPSMTTTQFTSWFLGGLPEHLRVYVESTPLDPDDFNEVKNRVILRNNAVEGC